MRSRYSAFVVGDVPYLLRTWHPRTRPSTLELDPEQEWRRLDIVESTGGGLLDTAGTVEFRAFYRLAGTPGVQHERSRFVRDDRAWLYVDGEVLL